MSRGFKAGDRVIIKKCLGTAIKEGTKTRILTKKFTNKMSIAIWYIEDPVTKTPVAVYENNLEHDELYDTKLMRALA